MKDLERQDLPHLSAFYRYSLCPISYQLSLIAPAARPNIYAEVGTRGHKALAGDEVELSHDEEDTITECRDRESAFVSEWSEGAELLALDREKRMFFKSGGAALFTGAPDVCYAFDDRAVIVLDYKMGFIQAPAPSVNRQLRGAALLAWQHYRATRVIVSIIQPNARWSPPAVYIGKDLYAAREEVQHLMNSVHSLDAQANPSYEACRMCPAGLSGICKAAYTPARAIATRKAEVVIEMSDDDLSLFGELALQAEIIIKLAISELKDRVNKRPDAFPNWYLQPTGSVSSVHDTQGAFAKFSDILSAKEFSDICKPSIKGLTDLLRTHLGLSESLARREVERRLGELLVKKLKAPALKNKQSWERLTTLEVAE